MSEENLWSQLRLLSQKDVRRVLCELCLAPGRKMSLKDLASRTGIPYTTVYQKIQAMRSASLIDMKGTKREGFTVYLRDFELPPLTPERICELEGRPLPNIL
ncbi:MAG: helix-turn-helix domain-containing protein [Candidatus Bathyarchaeia archaeon]